MSSISVAGRPLFDEQGAGVAGHLYIVYTDDLGEEFIISAYAAGGRFGTMIVQSHPFSGSYLVPREISNEAVSGHVSDYKVLDLGERTPEDVIMVMEQFSAELHEKELPYNLITQK